MKLLHYLGKLHVYPLDAKYKVHILVKYKSNAKIPFYFHDNVFYIFLPAKRNVFYVFIFPLKLHNRL